ncbi:MAG: DPP IV N-terminal domain-containing protein [Candidatus Aminicenantales bacterium]|jgi:dipeptidyl aminopeptidase/acylaminoacyl peptidase
MKRTSSLASIAVVLVFLISPLGLSAQGRQADYERANSLRDNFQSQALDIPGRAAWIEKTHRFWYRKTVKDGFEFELVDADTLAKRPAFDHEKLTAALNAATGEKSTAAKLPFGVIRFTDGEKAIEFEAAGFKWTCDLATYAVTKLGPVEGRRPWPVDEAPESKEPKVSPDGKREAFIRNYNVWVRSKDKDKKDEIALSLDGSEGNAYALGSIRWAPDSRKLAAYRVRPGYKRTVQYVESSPEDQVQPKAFTIVYAKPGDALDVAQPVVFDAVAKTRVDVDNDLFPNAFELSDIAWWKDGRGLTFEYNQRGHQVYRIIEVDPVSGKARALVSEEPKTFFCYSGKKYRYDAADGREIVWMSERDGWNHLYLYDGATGAVKNQITKGPWVVRGVDKVDEEKRQIYFRASGMVPGEDPYFAYPYRINFDGTGLTPLANGGANHAVIYSADAKFFVDTFSRVDIPPVCVLRRASDGKALLEVEKADIAGLVKAGWRPPEVFTAKGRDGRTDIWGIIFRPMNFDKSKKYPVIENIYAGPQDSFVPKSFMPYNGMMSLAELGFIVVQIDGMGTSNRSKAFHDVCWKDLGDAGFPDRILWHKAVAAKYPSYDISRVGIYGTSAGGQSAMGAVLFHPDFYKVSVASCGCHDNRMDKIWWNEQWMGWPLGPDYAASSNVDNAWRLRGKLLLFVGELDTNVDPSSTMQVVNALIKANKSFGLLVLPGQNHTGGGDYGERVRRDFFVHNLLGVEPPDWNKIDEKKKEGGTR